MNKMNGEPEIILAQNNSANQIQLFTTRNQRKNSKVIITGENANTNETKRNIHNRKLSMIEQSMNSLIVSDLYDPGHMMLNSISS